MNLGSSSSSSNRLHTGLLCVFLALGTVAVYWPMRSFELTNYDDTFLITNNPRVNGGLTPQNIGWALSTSYFDFWRPLSWLSHMLDCELFGAWAGGHHLTSLAFHVANTILLFLVLQSMTRAPWRSAMVAALFALHPLHVESVAWVAERKDVLSAFFFLLTLWAYARYAEGGSAEGGVRSGECGGRRAQEGKADSRWQTADGRSPKSEIRSQDSDAHHVSRFTFDSVLQPLSSSRYRLALLFFALGLMSKSMIVTLPFVLLLLDFWPLQRFNALTLQRSNASTLQRSNAFPLILEKLPFFTLSLLSCLITWSGMASQGNMPTAEQAPWASRLANVLVSYARYLGKMIWPADLAVLYPLPAHWPFWQVAGAALILLVISLAALRCLRRAPYLFCGWLLFLGMLVPVIGIVAQGHQSIADRYTYLPVIGLFIALVWGVADLAACWRWRGPFFAALSALVLLACGGLARLQVEHWRNSLALWQHCLAVTKDNVIAHFNLGHTLQEAGREPEAMDQYRQALRINPSHPQANLNLGIGYVLNHQLQEATNYFARALRARPQFANAHEALGMALIDLGDLAGGAEHCAEAVRLNPGVVRAYTGLGRCLSAQGKSDEALRAYAASLDRNPANPEAQLYLGLEWEKRGNLDQAAAALEAAARLDPAWPEPKAPLERVRHRRAASEALTRSRDALKLSPDAPEALNNLAWLLATGPEAAFRNGAEAVQLAQRACELTAFKQTVFVGTLAAAYAEAGQFEKAVETSKKACALAASLGETNLLARNQELLRQFEQRQPWREKN